MYYTLTKSQKKIARRVMDKGLDNDYQRGLKKAADIIERWKNEVFDNKDAYMKLYECINDTDDIIDDRYDGKGGSRWVEVMADQLANGVITKEDISEFDEEVQNVILIFAGKRGIDE
jgi:hypothetical protein